jgi:Zn finger protein HypA/HybF involved in hydrogenase expression
MKPLIISTRRAERRCVMCGKPLGEQTGPLADKHADCPSFQPGSDQNIVDTGYEAYRRNGYWKCRNCSRYIIPGSGVTRVWNSYDGQWERAHMDRYCPKCGAATMYRLR